MRSALIAVLLVLAMHAPAVAQTVKNPTLIGFVSVDHNVAGVTGYEIDIVRPDGTVAQTIVVPKSSTVVNSSGLVQVALNVQPVSFGLYTFVARTIAGTAKSPNSEPSASWERSPGAPSKLIAQ